MNAFSRTLSVNIGRERALRYAPLPALDRETSEFFFLLALSQTSGHPADRDHHEVKAHKRSS